MVVRSPATLSSLLVVLAATWGCSSAPSSAGDTNAKKGGTGNSNGTGLANANDGATGGDGSDAGDSTTKAVVDPNSTKISAASANGWCAAANQTTIVKSAGMAKAFSQLCNGATATQFMANKLVSTAFSGTGAPALQMINPIADAGGTVTAFFGVGIKLPITSQVEFTKSAPAQGSVANAIQLIKNQGDTPGAITSVAQTANPDKGWVRGWTIENISTKMVAIVNITTDYINQVDQYDLGGGYYMYTSQLKKGVQTMKDYQLITAGYDIGGNGYLLTVAQIGADDHGFPSVAIDTVSKIANATITFMYTSSVAGAK